MNEYRVRNRKRQKFCLESFIFLLNFSSLTVDFSDYVVFLGNPHKTSGKFISGGCAALHRRLFMMSSLRD
jgi:hypothetical protein